MDDEIALSEQEVVLTDRPLSDAAKAFLADGRSRFKSVNCFEFVPSDYELLWRVLDALPRGRFMEWGSGFGLGCGLAAILGFESYGIEFDGPLAEASRRLLADHQLPVTIDTGDYFEIPHAADVYFVYCWPGRMKATEEHFARLAPPDARLLICHGQSDIRCKVRMGPWGLKERSRATNAEVLARDTDGQ